jgi:uncharacterized protein (DUF2126 family)
MTALSAGDVRLTMGGEPTFVSIDDMEGDEWNTTALGATKRERAGVLLRRLQAALRAGRSAALRTGQVVSGRVAAALGAWCWWRRDGEAIWHDDRLIADETIDHGHGERERADFIDALAGRAWRRRGCVLPAYEDAWYYLWKERRLPTNVDPLKSELRTRRSGLVWRACSSKVSRRASDTCCRCSGAVPTRRLGG